MTATLPTTRKLLVVLPNWVGDVVLASPVLAALREQLPDTRIAYLMRSYVRDIVAGAHWHDDEFFWPAGNSLQRAARLPNLAARLRQHKLDTAVLLTNSFRSATAAWLASIPHRVGYARDARSWLLTHRLQPARVDGRFAPASVLPYYCKLAEPLGVTVADRALRLAISTDQEHAGRHLQKHYNLTKPYAVINPGAAFGAAKCWLPERFAQVCDALRADFKLSPVIVGAPNEVPLMRHIAELAESDPVCLADPGTSLASLKVIIRDARLLVCNDTGPRHYGNAFRVPTVTIFGPTHQAWTETDYDLESCIQADVPCGPCQLKQCPLDLRCMHEVTVDWVLREIRVLLEHAPNTAGRPMPATH